MPSAGLRIAAIHNGELETSPARLVVDRLRSSADVVTEIVAQSPFDDSVDVDNLLSWRRRQEVLERRWSTYLGRPRPAILAAAGRRAFTARVRMSKTEANKLWRVRQIERAVSAKHAFAWREFLEGGESELLVVESDAGLTDTTDAAMQSILDNPCDTPRYINVAGGLDPQRLGIVHLAAGSWSENPQFVRYEPPVTNTSCAYVVNQAMANAAIRHLDKNPEDHDLGIDWLMNAIFLANSAESRMAIECWHADPPAIIHGSTRGLTKSWHPSR